MKTLKFQNPDQFIDECKFNPTIISDAILDSIKNNINSDINELHIFDVTFDSTDDVLEVVLQRKDILNALQKNIKFYEEEEKYEICLEIQNLITKFK